MIVRLTFLNFLPAKLEEAKKVYNDEVVGVVKKQKGNLDCRLLEPVDKADDYISMTVWETKEDADAYHTSGVYKQLVEKVRNDFSKEPVLKVYTAESVLEPA
jgi:heme-degrading monooxygenase HmoA